MSPGEAPLLPRDEAGLAGEATGGVERLVRMGERSLAAGDHGTATSLLAEALARDGGNREAALLLGQVHLATGAPQDAGMAFGRILRHSPGDREASIGYAKAMIAIGRSEAALEHLAPLVARDARDTEALNLQGVAHDLQGEHERAIAAYRQGLAVAADAADLRGNLGLSLALAGHHAEAIATLRPLAEGYASSPRHRQNLALALGLAGDLAAAERWSRMDLAEAQVENNLRYFLTLRGLAPGGVRSAALQPDFTRPAVPTVTAPRLARPALPATVPPVAQAPVEAPAPSPASPPEAPPRALRISADGPGDAGLAMTETAIASVGVEAASLGEWFVDLGGLPEARWRELRRSHATAGLRRLAAGDGASPLIVGPFASADEAAGLCRLLDDTVDSCTPVRL